MAIANIWDISEEEVDMASRSRRPPRVTLASRDDSDVENSSDKENIQRDEAKRRPSKQRSLAAKPEPKRKASIQ